jgi:hypothetical protein
LDLSAATEPLYGIPEKFKSMVAGLDDEIAAKRVSIEYSVVSSARSIPTAVLVVDVDASGAAVVGTTSAAFVSVLASNGFAIVPAALGPESIIGKDDPSILETAKASLGGAKRFAYGTATIASVRDDGGQKIATVSAEIKVVELATGRILYSASKQASAFSSNERGAVESARRQLGQKVLGEDVAANLP